MKTFIYFITAVIIAMTLFSPVQTKPGETTTVILRADAGNPSADLLKQSSDLIAERLKAFGLTSFELKVMADKEEIKVVLPGDTRINEIEDLLTSRGELAFYETCPGKDISGKLKSSQEEITCDAVIASSIKEDPELVARAEQFLSANNLCPDHKLFWGVKGDKPVFRLYVLKTDHSGNPVLTGAGIKKISTAHEQGGMPKIDFNFNPEATKIWAEATEKNLGKPIAIVLDNRVLCTPVVRQAIKSGFCEITGDYSEKEIVSLVALISHGPLPVSFTIVR
jgi:preprotein translocase subunit SecD